MIRPHIVTAADGQIAQKLFWRTRACLRILIYGMYHCFNVITAPVGTPQGVLIRALEPVDGIEEIKLARYNKTDITKAQYKNLTSGPGKLCRALGITLKNEAYHYKVTHCI